MMLKQVIYEVAQGDDLVVLVNGVQAEHFFDKKFKGKFPQKYDDPDLVGKKEYEEVKIGNVTKYWVGVPEKIDENVARIYVDKAKLAWAQKRDKKFLLIAAKRLRIMRYAQLVEQGLEINPTNEEVNDALALAKLENKASKLEKLLVA